MQEEPHIRAKAMIHELVRPPGKTLLSLANSSLQSFREKTLQCTKACSLYSQDRASVESIDVGGGGVEEKERGRGGRLWKESRDPDETVPRRKSCHDRHVKWTHETKSCLAGWPRPREKAPGEFTRVVS